MTNTDRLNRQLAVDEYQAYCFLQPDDVCNACQRQRQLMCRYDVRDTLHFFMIILPFFTAAISGVILAGYGWYMAGWLAYALFFFFVWEANVLCRHCPYWAEEGRVLRCHANYGVIKLWKYRPGPMSRSEQVQFLVGAGLFFLYPMVFMILGKMYVFAVISLVSAVSFGYLLRRNICTRCIHFSCPLNGVSDRVAQSYQLHNKPTGEVQGK